MINIGFQSFLVSMLVFALPLANSQSSRKDQENWDTHIYSLERYFEKERNSAQSQTSGDSFGLAPVLLLGLIGGVLFEWSRQPQAQRPAVDYVKVTKHLRESLIYRQCKKTHQSSHIYPTYDKPNSWALIAIFQGNRADEYKAAIAKHQTAVAEAEPTCKCVSERSTSESGFSEQEWQRIAASRRMERPWTALEESRTKSVFEACATKSPSSTDLSWLYSGATQ